MYEFNDQMIDFLGYQKAKFGSDLMSYGLPEINPNANKRYGAVMYEIINTFLKEDYDGTPVEHDSEVIHSNFRVRK